MGWMVSLHSFKRRPSLNDKNTDWAGIYGNSHWSKQTTAKLNELLLLFLLLLLLSYSLYPISIFVFLLKLIRCLLHLQYSTVQYSTCRAIREQLNFYAARAEQAVMQDKNSSNQVTISRPYGHQQHKAAAAAAAAAADELNRKGREREGHSGAKRKTPARARLIYKMWKALPLVSFSPRARETPSSFIQLLIRTHTRTNL